MKAFVIFAGGGVKGAALAGCLQETLDRKIDIQGYGGTSAGAIVALLACVGYTGDEINDLLATEIHPISLLANEGEQFRKAKQLAIRGNEILSQGIGLAAYFKAGFFWFWNRKFISKIMEDFGLDDGEVLESKILDLVKRKVPGLKRRKKFHLKT